MKARAAAARVTAQAKINLILRVLAREESGFHALETIVARLAIGDSITVRPTRSARSVNCTGADTGPAERNLAYLAALAFAEATGWPDGFAIEIEKRIPVGAGLGGGSADAAAVLRALAALSPRAVSEAALLGIAAALGSDVPVLTTAAPLALAWGRGERMLALPSLPQRDIALVTPTFAVSTADAYSWLAAERAAHADVPSSPRSASPISLASSSRTASPLLLSLADLASWNSLAPLAANDFEPLVSRRHPEISRTISALRASGASIALMSGSGSTVFGVFDSPPSPSRATLSTLPGTLRLTRAPSPVAPVELIR
jgi:4-diphosphocytidyl-2-C-methyl-D-erythritol kinase